MIARLVSLPTLFLTLLSIFTLSIAFLQTAEKLPAITQPVFLRSKTIQIIEKQRYNVFGSTYKVKLDNTHYSLISVNSLNVGKSYIVSGELSEYSNLDLKTSEDSSYIRYNLSNGIYGKIDKVKIESSLVSCSLHCLVQSQTENLKINISKVYDHYYCKFFYDYLNLLQIDKCQNMVGWATGLTIGGGESFSKDYLDLTKNLNLTHLLVVSGFQVSIFAAWIEVGLLRSSVSKKFRLLLAFSALFLFAMIVGFEPPVLRAILSLVISQQILFWFGRKLSPFYSLIYSGLLLLLFNPWWLYSYSFWLSFTTSVGLVIAYNQEYILLNSKKWWKEIIISSIVALVFSLPLVIDLNNGINLTGLVGNIIIGPIIPLLTFLNLFALVPLVGYFFAFLAMHLQAFIIYLTYLLSGLSVYVSFNSLNLIDKIIYYICVVLIIVLFQILTTKLNSFKIQNIYDNQPTRANSNSQTKT